MSPFKTLLNFLVVMLLVLGARAKGDYVVYTITDLGPGSFYIGGVNDKVVALALCNFPPLLLPLIRLVLQLHTCNPITTLIGCRLD